MTWALALLVMAVATTPAAARIQQKSAPTAKLQTKVKQADRVENAVAKKRVKNLQRVKKTSSANADRVRAPTREITRKSTRLINTERSPRLQSQAAIVIDQDTQQVLFKKNEQTVLPMASITKLMTAMIVSQARLPMDKEISISTDDIDTQKGSTSRLVIGSTLPRSEMLHIALMSSENRAANALARTFPGGMATFVTLMNAKARSLGMTQTRYVEPTGLSSHNVSTAKDLAILVKAAHSDALLRRYSTTIEHDVTIGDSVLQYNTTNPLVRDPNWQIGLQKTGYISEAGRCMVMQARVAGRKVIMVFLDSATQKGRTADAQGIRRWIEHAGSSIVAMAETTAALPSP